MAFAFPSHFQYPEGLSNMAKLLCVNYHYVREENPSDFPYGHFVKPELLRKQIQLLSQNYDFPTPEELEVLITKPSLSDKKYCALTFDDGLAEHWSIVVPILEEFDILGMFFVNTLPWVEKCLLSVHLAHVLSSAYTYKELRGDIEQAAHAAGIKCEIDKITESEARQQYRYDEIDTARVKFFLNAKIPQKIRRQLLQTVFEKRLGSEQAFARHYYLRPHDIKELEKKGHTVGLHTHSHLHLASASPEERRQDIQTNQDLLSDVLHKKPQWISYPYGGTNSFNELVIQDVQGLECHYGLTMLRGINETKGIDPFRLLRIDTNDALGGKKPLLNLQSNNNPLKGVVNDGPSQNNPGIRA